MARGIPGKHPWMGRWPAQQASRLGRYDVTKNDITRVTKVQRTEETGPSEWKDGKQCGGTGIRARLEAFFSIRPRRGMRWWTEMKEPSLDVYFEN